MLEPRRITSFGDEKIENVGLEASGEDGKEKEGTDFEKSEVRRC